MEKITDEHDLVMCPLGNDRLCTRGGIDVDDPECGLDIDSDGVPSYCPGCGARVVNP